MTQCASRTSLGFELPDALGWNRRQERVLLVADDAMCVEGEPNPLDLASECPGDNCEASKGDHGRPDAARAWTCWRDHHSGMLTHFR